MITLHSLCFLDKTIAHDTKNSSKNTFYLPQLPKIRQNMSFNYNNKTKKVTFQKHYVLINQFKSTHKKMAFKTWTSLDLSYLTSKPEIFPFFYSMIFLKRISINFRLARQNINFFDLVKKNEPLRLFKEDLLS